MFACIMLTMFSMGFKEAHTVELHEDGSVTASYEVVVTKDRYLDIEERGPGFFEEGKVEFFTKDGVEYAKQVDSYNYEKIEYLVPYLQTLFYLDLDSYNLNLKPYKVFSGGKLTGFKYEETEKILLFFKNYTPAISISGSFNTNALLKDYYEEYKLTIKFPGKVMEYTDNKGYMQKVDDYTLSIDILEALTEPDYDMEADKKLYKPFKINAEIQPRNYSKFIIGGIIVGVVVIAAFVGFVVIKIKLDKKKASKRAQVSESAGLQDISSSEDSLQEEDTGYIDSNGNRFYLDENGRPFYMDKDGYPFYIDDNGIPFYIDSNGNPFYIDENGRPFYVLENGQIYYPED